MGWGSEEVGREWYEWVSIYECEGFEVERSRVGFGGRGFGSWIEKKWRLWRAFNLFSDSCV